MSDLIDRQAAIDAFNTNLNELVVGGEENAKTVENYLNRVLDKIKCLPSALGTNLAEVGTDRISRRAAIDAAIEATDDWDGGSNIGRQKRIENYINRLPSAQPEQRYTEEELRVFKHGISLSLLSKRSAQHWRYDEDMATEIKFLERLYDKVVADMGGEQDG